MFPTTKMLEKFYFLIDPKNIGYQNLEDYKASLLLRMEDLVSRMRWKLYHTRKRIKAKPRTDLSQSDLN